MRKRLTALVAGAFGFCPYGQHFSLALLRPSVTRLRLHEMLAPTPGQRVLEVGPGTGYTP